MSYLIVTMANNHPQLSAWFSSNSFGDQVILVREEHPDGTRTEYTETFSEGSWIEFNKASILALHKRRKS